MAMEVRLRRTTRPSSGTSWTSVWVLRTDCPRPCACSAWPTSTTASSSWTDVGEWSLCFSEVWTWTMWPVRRTSDTLISSLPPTLVRSQGNILNVNKFCNFNIFYLLDLNSKSSLINQAQIPTLVPLPLMVNRDKTLQILHHYSLLEVKIEIDMIVE